MLSDSNTAEENVKYLVTNGLSPYFHDELWRLIDGFYVICFDKVYNEIFKKGQIDHVIRFSDRTSYQIAWYLPSSFIDNSTAKDMKSFLDAYSEMKVSNFADIDGWA